MPTIHLQTRIAAPIERAFDLSRSIDLHKLSTGKTHEEAIAGRTSGLIELGETVTWRAKHLGVYQKLTVQITQMEKPHLFADKMLRGAFESMEHLHRFETIDGGTLMTDVFHFSSPLGPLGKLGDWLFLKRYMTRFLLERNRVLKAVAEGEKWRALLGLS